jgi:hypothetical protein
MAIFSHDTQWVPAERPGARAGRLPAIEPIRIGAYLHSARDLYRVEDLTGGRALIEDCLSGDLLNVPLSELLTLTPVRDAGMSD